MKRIWEVADGDCFWFDAYIYLKIGGECFSLRTFERVNFHSDVLVEIAGRVGCNSPGVTRTFYPTEAEFTAL